MKTIIGAFIVALLFVSLAVQSTALAEAEGVQPRVLSSFNSKKVK